MEIERRRLLWLAALFALTIPACGDDVGGALTGKEPLGQRQVKFPSQVLGLTVVSEPIGEEVTKNKRPYIRNVVLFSLRETDLVRATLQVSEFNNLARPDDPEFLSSIIEQVSATRPARLRVGKDVVYSTIGTEQSIFVWFYGRRMFVLTTHRDYEFRRTLLRHSVQLAKQA